MLPDSLKRLEKIVATNSAESRQLISEMAKSMVQGIGRLGVADCAGGRPQGDARP